MVSCLFCELIKQIDKNSIVFEDNISIAFLDKRPLFIGHSLLIPKIHVSTFSELPEEYIGPFYKNAQKISIAIEKALQADGIFIAINNKVSQSVPHLHVHLVPRRFKDGLKGFFWPRTKYENDEHRNVVALQIKSALKL